MSDLFSVLPNIGDVIGDSIGSIFSGYNINGQFDLWASNIEWGVRMCMSGAGTLGPLGAAYTLLTTFVPSLPNNVGACFSIGGPMSGSGLPIKVSMTAAGKTMSMYFCSKDSQCPGWVSSRLELAVPRLVIEDLTHLSPSLPSGYQCNYGLCATIGCPSAHPNMQGLLCYDSCRSGYTNILGVCWENCRSGFVDAGASCVQAVGASCPSGYEKDAGLCYPRCRDGYNGIGPVCWERCRDGFTDIGALCSRGAVTRGKGCCCFSKLKCKRWKCSWKKSCCDNCDDGFSDTGCTCFRGASTYAKKTYGRSASSALYFKNTYVIPAYPLSVKVAGLVW